jgi:hypothetical protein
MHSHNQLLSFGVAFVGIINAVDIVKAQGAFTPATSPFNFPPPAAIDYQKPEQIRPDLYGPNGSDPAPRFRSPDRAPTPSRTYRLDTKDLYTFTNLGDPQVAAGQYANFSGSYSGKYSVPFIYNLGIPIKGTLNLNQSGDQVIGTMVSEIGRQAVVRGVVKGSQLVAELTFNDSCSGTGSLIADLAPTGDLITGKYRVLDCNGKYSGRYKVKRE